MKKKILITNFSSYIGKALCRQISSKNYDLYAFYPEGEDPRRYAAISDKISLIPLSIDNTLILKKHFELNDYDTVLHIPDFHSSSNKSRYKLRISNVFALQQVMEYCLRAKANLIYCSSVAIYGNSPFELPSNDQTEKIVFGRRAKMIAEMESLIERNRLKGLKAVIIRPSILYGKDCCGFMKVLIRLIRYRLLPNVNERIYIHLCNINLVANILEKAITNEHALGKNYNVADDEPVILKELVNFINKQLHHKNYKTVFVLNLYIGRNIANLFYRLNWPFGGNFIERLTHNWFYDTEDLERDFNVPKYNTFTGISEMIEK